MAIQNHDYHVSVQWQGGRDGHGTVTTEASRLALPLAVPPEFLGAGGGTNPEELLTSAVAGCYTLTLGIIGANRKLPIVNISSEVTGTVEQNGPNLTFKRIVVKPTIIVTSDATDAQIAVVTEMAHKADNYCIITNAIRDKVEVVVEPLISRL